MASTRLMLSTADKSRLLSALRADIDLKTSVSDDLQAWNAAQHDYRLAEAIARPKRGVRAHKLKAYDWYFEHDRTTPLRDLDLWISEASGALAVNHARAPSAPGIPPPPAESFQ